MAPQRASRRRVRLRRVAAALAVRKAPAELVAVRRRRRRRRQSRASRARGYEGTHCAVRPGFTAPASHAASAAATAATTTATASRSRPTRCGAHQRQRTIPKPCRTTQELQQRAALRAAPHQIRALKRRARVGLHLEREARPIRDGVRHARDGEGGVRHHIHGRAHRRGRHNHAKRRASELHDVGRHALARFERRAHCGALRHAPHHAHDQRETRLVQGVVFAGGEGFPTSAWSPRARRVGGRGRRGRRERARRPHRR